MILILPFAGMTCCDSAALPWRCVTGPERDSLPLNPKPLSMLFLWTNLHRLPSTQLDFACIAWCRGERNICGNSARIYAKVTNRFLGIWDAKLLASFPQASGFSRHGIGLIRRSRINFADQQNLGSSMECICLLPTSSSEIVIISGEVLTLHFLGSFWNLHCQILLLPDH